MDIKYALQFLILLTTLCSCSSNQGVDKKMIDKYINSDGQDVVEYQISDSIIERVLTRNDKLEAKEIENTYADSIIVYYYDEFEKLYQSVKFSTTNPSSLVENCVYYDNEDVAERYIKTQENETLATYNYNYYGNLIEAIFKRKGAKGINSFVNYTSKGEVDTNKENKFLSIQYSNDSIHVTVIGDKSETFEQINLYVLEKFNEEQVPYFMVDTSNLILSLRVSYTNRVSFSLSSIMPHTKDIKCAVSYGNRGSNGNWNYEEQEFYIESLLKVPENNLSPIYFD